jgi:undecaprenyl-diphosphatase
VHVIAIFIGLSFIGSLAGFGIKSWNPGFDHDAIGSIVAHGTARLTSIAAVVSDAGSFALLGPLAVAFVLLRRWKRPADDLSLLVIAAGCAGLPSVIKLIVQRPRPLFPDVHLLTFSFPSEHTTQAAGIYLTIALLLSKGIASGRRRLVIALAVLMAMAVAWSRVYLGAHYPTDVAAGLLLGWGWALLVFRFARLQLTQSVTQTVTAPNGAATS